MIVDGRQIVRWLLLAAGTESAFARDAGLAADQVVLHGLVGDRVWTPRIPRVESYANLRPAIWFTDSHGEGPDEHVEDLTVWYEFCALGGRDGGVAGGALRMQAADQVMRGLLSVVMGAAGVVTPHGVIVSVRTIGGPYEQVDEVTKWPYQKVLLAVETGGA